MDKVLADLSNLRLEGVEDIFTELTILNPHVKGEAISRQQGK